jgi:transposase
MSIYRARCSRWRVGTSVVDFFARFPDEKAILEHVFTVRFGNHSPCPRCGRMGRWTPIGGTRKYQHACRRHISVLENTVFYRSNLSLMVWFYAMLLMCNSSIGMSGSFVRRQLGLGTRGANRLVNRIRLQMAAYDRPEMIGGHGKIVYVDEVLIKYARTGPLGRTPNGVNILGFACDGKVVSGAIRDRTGNTLLAAIDRFVKPGSRIISDGHRGYASLARRGWLHTQVNHSKGFFPVDGMTTNEIEAYWSVLKRTLAVFRMINSDNLWLYLAESEFRYNHRRSPRSNFDHLTSYFADVAGSAPALLKRRYDWR